MFSTLFRRSKPRVFAFELDFNLHPKCFPESVNHLLTGFSQGYFHWYVCSEVGTRAPWFSTSSLLGPLHYPWVLSVVFKCFSNRQDHFSDHFSMRSCPERAYILASFVCHSGFRLWAWPRLLTLSFLMFWKPFARLWYLLQVTFYCASCFQTGFHSGLPSPFPFIASVASSCFIAYIAFSCYYIACVAFTLVFLGECRPPVSHFWRESLSLVSWCLSYFALHFVFIACVAYKFVFSWRVSPSGCFYGECRLQVVFKRVSPSS